MLKRKRISLEQALIAIKIYEKIPVRFMDIDFADALILADQLSIYAYDAYLIQCALKYKAPLLTLDKNLVGYALKMGVRVIEVNL